MFEEYEKNGKIALENNVSNETRLLIGDFSILWNLYERNILDKITNPIIAEFKKTHGKDEKCIIYQDEIHRIFIDRLLAEYEKFDSNTKKKYDNTINNNFNKFYSYYRSNCFEYKFDSNYINKYFNISNGARNEADSLFNKNINKDIHNWDLFDKLHLLLIVIYRVRNNMFHGNKRVAKLDQQADLFYIGNDIISLLLDDIDYLINHTGSYYD